MTAVNPVTLETVLDVEDGQTTVVPVSLFVENYEQKMEGIEIGDDIVPERKETIADSLAPLLGSMKLFGLYFPRPPKDAGDDRNERSRKWNVYVIYGAAIVTLLWLNAVRMLSAFTQDDQFGPFLFHKFINVTWSIQAAVSQTAFYAACFSGRLEVVLRQPLDGSCARHGRKFAAVLAVVAWLIIISCSVFFIYGLFFTGGLMDVAVAPLQAQIITSHLVIPRIIALFIIFYLLSAYIFSQAMTFVLAMIFSNQFIRVSKALASCLDSQQRQVSDFDIETFRQKHQEISMSVTDVDDCLMFSNASAFCSQLSCFIVLLYMMIFYKSFTTDPVLTTVQVFWMFLFSAGLTLTAAGGISVHHYVSRVTLPLVCAFYWPKCMHLNC